MARIARDRKDPKTPPDGPSPFDGELEKKCFQLVKLVGVNIQWEKQGGVHWAHCVTAISRRKNHVFA